MMMMQATPRIARQETVRLSQLEARRDEIREQLESVTQWRGRLVQERHNASATNNQTVVRELDGRLGIREVEAVQTLAAQVGLQGVDDIAMPANNRCLIWRRA